MILYGTTHHVGDGITTAAIIAPEHRADADPAWLAAHCLADVDLAIAESAREGDLLLAGAGFGAGPDAELAVLALQAVGFAAIVCASADAGFVEAAGAGAPATPRCQHAPPLGFCGGCTFQDRSYEAQVAAKRAALQALWAGDLPAELLEQVTMVGSPNPFEYRTRMDYVTSKERFG